MSTSDQSADPGTGSVGQGLRPVQRTGAYVRVVDEAGAVLLVRASPRSDLAGQWFLPGGGLRHGEHPLDGVRRELVEETGLRAGREALVALTASADVIDLPHRGVSVHTLRLVLSVPLEQLRALDGGPAGAGSLRGEVNGTSDLARFVSPDELAHLSLMPFVAEVLGRPVPPLPEPTVPQRPDRLVVSATTPEPRPIDPALGALDAPDPGTERADGQDPGMDGESPVPVQRPAAYAVLVDETPDDPRNWRILLSRLSQTRMPTRPGGVWTLPGGGIDHGEHPLVALRREVYEETGLPYTEGHLLDIGSRHFIGRAPSGRLEDFQALRLVYTGSVPVDVAPRVTEVEGSTEAAAWIPLAELDRIATAPAVRESLAIWTAARQGTSHTATGR